MKSGSGLWWAICFVASACATAGLGERSFHATGVLAVSEAAGPEPELIELTRQLREAVAMRTAGVLETADLRDRMAGPTGVPLAEIGRAHKAALEKYQRGEYEACARGLRAIVADLERSPESPAAFALWSSAMLRLARTEELLPGSAGAAERLDRLLRVAPGVKAPSPDYPPSFAEELEKARGRLEQLPTRILRVSSNRARARVFVEGREVGIAPVSLALPAGRYRVSGVVGEARLPAEVVDMANDRSLFLDFSVVEILRPGQVPGLALTVGDRSAATLIPTARWLRLDRLISASMRTRGDSAYLVASVYDAPRDALVREGLVRLGPTRSLPPGALNGLADFLLTGRPAPGVEEVARPFDERRR